MEIQEWVSCSPDFVRGKQEISPGVFRLYEGMDEVGYIDDMECVIFVKRSLINECKKNFPEYNVKPLQKR